MLHVERHCIVRIVLLSRRIYSVYFYLDSVLQCCTVYSDSSVGGTLSWHAEVSGFKSR